MSPCMEPRYADLLYAFELGMLDDEESHQVESHLYECDHCFAQARSFSRALRLLRGDPEVRTRLEQYAQLESAGDEPHVVAPPLGRRRSLVVRYALAAALVLALGLPLYHYSTRDPIQELVLTPVRGATEPVISIARGGLARIQFSVEDIAPGGTYHLTVYNLAGDTVYVDREYGGLGADGVGRVEIPVHHFISGHYLLTISDPTGRRLEADIDYLFLVR